MHIEENGPAAALPVVFIHGFPFNSTMWKPQVEALKKTYRTIVYDVRGHGRSDAGDGQYTIELFADDLTTILDERRIGKAVVVGLSMGGYIALRFAERSPERLKGLVLCDTRSDADSNEAKIRRAAQMRAVKEHGTRAFAEEFVKAVLAPETFRDKPDIVKSVEGMIEHNPVAGIAGTLLALASRTDTTQSLPKLNVPVLIAVGEADAATPPGLAFAMHERIPGSEVVVIPHAGHLSTLENPDVFNPALKKFLAGLS